MAIDRRGLLGLSGAVAIAGWPRIAEPAEELLGVGGGSLFPVLDKWAGLWRAERGVPIGYKSFGSVNGIEFVKQKKAPFGGSEKPLRPFELSKNAMVQFPIAALGFVPIINVPNVTSGQIVLDDEVLPAMFRGLIKTWSDERIRARNPEVQLPDLPVIPVNRREGSGTTFNVSNYFSKVDLGWMYWVGDGFSVDWPAGVTAGGTAGVAAKVRETPGGIGFVEYTYALHNAVTTADMFNRRKKRVSPNAETFTAAVTSAKWHEASDFNLSLTNQDGERSWPLAAAGYILMRRDAERATTASLLDFFEYCLHDGADIARQLNYVPMPPDVVEMIEAKWSLRFDWTPSKRTKPEAHTGEKTG